MIIASAISRCRIVAKLGEGGMGVVYNAEDAMLNRLAEQTLPAQRLLDDTEAIGLPS